MSLAQEMLLGRHRLKESHPTLKISIHEDRSVVVITLEGRIAGPWVAELSRVWVETAPKIASRKLSVDLRNVTYADVRGEQVLRDMCTLARTEFVTSTPWTKYLANLVNGSNEEDKVEAGNGYES